MGTTFRSLRNKNLRIFSVGGVISNTGAWMQSVAQDWLVLELTDNSATALGITIGLQFAPTLILSSYAGVLIDRFSRARILMATTVMLALISTFIGTLAITGVAELWQVYTLVFIFGIVTAFEGPARQAFVSEVVTADDLANAVGLNSAAINLARLIGPALSGLLIAAFGSGPDAAGWVIIINAAAYMAVIVTMLRMDRSALRITPPMQRRRRELREGIRYVREVPDMKIALVAAFLCGAFALNFQLFAVLMATEVYSKGAGEFGLLGSSLAIGSLLGALIAARRSRPDGRLIIRATTAFSVALTVAGLLPTYLAFVLWSPVLGFLALTALTAINGTLQLRSTDQFRGRVMALYFTALLGGSAVGGPALGIAADHFGARSIMIGGGAVVLLSIAITHMFFRYQPTATRLQPPGLHGAAPR